MAKLVADSVLEQRPNLKNVHSNASMRRLLEREAKQYMYDRLPQPTITIIEEEPRVKRIDASNLPYLHRNPAV